MMRCAGVQVKSQPIIYVIGAFLAGIYDEGLPCIAIKTVFPHLDDREASGDPPPVSLAGQSLWLTTVKAIAQPAEIGVTRPQ
jgi:hypothetical protein